MLSEMAQKGGMIMEGKTKPAFIDRAVHDSVCRDDRDWMIEHFEMRLHELMKKGAHHTHPWITERYESDLNHLYKSYRPAGADCPEEYPEEHPEEYPEKCPEK